MPVKKRDPEKTIEALLKISKRPHVPLARTFVQQRDSKGKGRPGPLSRFVVSHNERALKQYLLLHAVASGGDWGAAYSSEVWASGLRLDENKPSVRNSISRNWAWLEREKLIERGRKGRDAKVTLLYDDASGDPYVHPHDRDPRERFLKLSYRFWRENWDTKLDLPALAVLLILLHERPGPVPLVAERIPEWYGIATSTFEKGVQKLRRSDLLDRRRDQVEAPLSRIGVTFVYSYRLVGPFERNSKERNA